MKINKDRPIGRVLYIVEGSKTEFVLLRKIFCDVLGYEYIEKRRNRPSFFYKENNIKSTIAVVNTKDSNIRDISEEEYLNDLFEFLINNYDFPVDKSAIYYLFDRDPKSNTNPALFEWYVKSLKDPYENSNGLKAGQLLVSYPSIESYMISSFQKSVYLTNLNLGSDAKAYIGDNNEIQINRISEETLLNATNEFFAYLQTMSIVWDIDDFSDASNNIFQIQEDNYSSGRGFSLFSMLTLSFLQLGIIEIQA